MPKDKIGILKSIWKKNDAGVWTGHDLKSIGLNPRKGFAQDYFKIENEVNLMTQRPGYIMNDFFATFGTTEFLVRQSIVPIVAWNDGDEEIRCIGTGFFISASGLSVETDRLLRPAAGDHDLVAIIGAKVSASRLTFTSMGLIN